MIRTSYSAEVVGEMTKSRYLFIAILALTLFAFFIQADARRRLDPSEKISEQVFLVEPQPKKARSTLSAHTFGYTYINRNRTFDPNYVDAEGRSNLQRMEKGLAPIGVDGKSVQIHHFTQSNEGKRVEVTVTEHAKIRHDKLGNSEIDRIEFAKERREHWKQRREDFR